MTGIALRIAEPTGRYRRSLRRYTASGGAGCAGGYHDASTDIGDVAEAERAEASGDNWPHDDARWPQACESCGYVFAPEDRWTRSDRPVYQFPDGTGFVLRHSLGQVAPAGTMIRAAWYDQHASQPGESWLVALPDGGEWITTQSATGGGSWTVTGIPPLITVTPSIWHNQPAGWHGWIRDGHLVAA